MTETSDTPDRLRAAAARLRLEGKAADAGKLDDLADNIQRHGLEPAVEQHAAALEQAGKPHQAIKMRALIVRAKRPASSSGRSAAVALGICGVLLLARGRA